MPKITVGCKVAPSIAQELDELADRIGVSRAALLEDAIAQFLKRDTAKTLTNAIKDLTVRLSRLEEKHQALSVLVVSDNPFASSKARE